MSVQRDRVETLLRQALETLRNGATTAKVTSLVNDALDACHVLECESVDHTEYVLAARARGMTFQEIGEQIGKSRERVRQIALNGERKQRRDANEAMEGPICAESPLDRLDLSVFVHRALESADIETIGDLARLDDRKLLRLRGFGRKALLEVRSVLAQHGIERLHESAAQKTSSAE